MPFAGTISAMVCLKDDEPTEGWKKNTRRKSRQEQLKCKTHKRPVTWHAELVWPKTAQETKQGQKEGKDRELKQRKQKQHKTSHKQKQTESKVTQPTKSARVPVGENTVGYHLLDRE